MATTPIEWTHRPGTIGVSWNPVRGCSMAKGSEAGGCLNCYAARMAARNLPGHRSPTTGKPFAVMRGAGPRWTGDVELIPEKLAEPLRWRKPRTLFVNSMSDLFHERLSFEAIAAVFGVMWASPQHTHLILTKRPERAAEFCGWLESEVGRSPVLTCIDAMQRLGVSWPAGLLWEWPLLNVWLGTSVEDQPTADARIPHLLRCPAAVRFVSYEPALGPVDFRRIKPWHPIHGPDGADALCGGSWGHAEVQAMAGGGPGYSNHTGAPVLHWLIAGGESGPGARPPHPDWFRSVREQCAAAGVPFFFKQWGEWAEGSDARRERRVILSNGDSCGWAKEECEAIAKARGGKWSEFHPTLMHRAGKKAAGALLDGREHREWPEVSA